jgi:hypothetical protein
MNCSSHNFYWYQTKAGRFLLVPWDLDLTWGAKEFETQPTWDKPAASCATERYMLWGWPHLIPSCDPILGAANAMRALYLQAVRDMLAGPYDVVRLRSDIDRWAAAIAEAVRADRAIAFPEWQAQVAGLKAKLEVHRQRMAALLK